MGDDQSKMTKAQAPIEAPSLEEACPFCFESKIAKITDCFDLEAKKICELWYCEECGGFFPKVISIPKGADSSSKAKGRRRAIKDSEKRNNPRFPVQFVVQVSFDGDEENVSTGFSLFGRKKKSRKEIMSEPIVAMVMNAGVGGLCFRYPEMIEEGRESMMKISLPSAQRSFSAVGKVVRATKLPDGSFGLGVQFVKVDPEYKEALQRYITLD